MKIHAFVNAINTPLYNGSVRFDVQTADSSGLVYQLITVDIADASITPGDDIKDAVIAFAAAVGYAVTSADVVLWGGPQ